MQIILLLFFLFFIPLIILPSYSELLIESDKDAILPFGEAASLTIQLDYIPYRNLVFVNIFDSTDYLYIAGREVQVDQSGILKFDFQGYVRPLTGGVYKMIVTGTNEKNEIIKDTGFFSMGLKDDQTTSEQNSENGGCLIVTATFGSELAPQVQQLRELRDNTVLSTQSGTVFMTGFNQLYYSFSPTIADLERQHPVFKEIVKLSITPMLSSLSLLNYVDIDSEQEMLGYGISLILLNIGMYFASPVIIIYKIRK